MRRTIFVRLIYLFVTEIYRYLFVVEFQCDRLRKFIQKTKIIEITHCVSKYDKNTDKNSFQ